MKKTIRRSAQEKTRAKATEDHQKGKILNQVKRHMRKAQQNA